jgi:hypothetical protein
LVSLRSHSRCHRLSPTLHMHYVVNELSSVDQHAEWEEVLALG